jgi:hypothetical protein
MKSENGEHRRGTKRILNCTNIFTDEAAFVGELIVFPGDSDIPTVFSATNRIGVNLRETK